MKAIVRAKYGGPETMSIGEVSKPTPAKGHVLVRVKAAGLNAADKLMMRGTPFIVRVMGGGLITPKATVLGADIAGVVESVGSDVRTWKPGDEVIADLSSVGFGGLAEHVAAPATLFARKPSNLSFEHAAALPMAAGTALQGLRDHAKVSQGMHVLVNGASGGVGSFAVQIAKALGAHVTAVCSTRNVDRMYGIGADDVVDYTVDDVTKSDRQFDVIFDAAAHRDPADYKVIMSNSATYLLSGGDSLFKVLLFGWSYGLGSKRTFKNFLAKVNAVDLGTITELVEQGKITPLLHEVYGMEQIQEAMSVLDSGHTQGKLVVRIS